MAKKLKVLPALRLQRYDKMNVCVVLRISNTKLQMSNNKVTLPTLIFVIWRLIFEISLQSSISYCLMAPITTDKIICGNRCNPWQKKLKVLPALHLQRYDKMNVCLALRISNIKLQMPNNKVSPRNFDIFYLAFDI